ncbi:MAG TPA: hypothetical protein VNN74_08745 [Candidatus Micrarchaeia archaeon]|nr:hypothetical protein [Candidatus Micrarchaeia archaeon]
MTTLTRHHVPEDITGTTRFSDDPVLASPTALVGMVKGIAPVRRALRDACRRTRLAGPDRLPGEWPLLYLTFVISRIPDIEPWYQRVCDDQRLWSACGFSTVPSYRLVHRRFTELEAIAPAFEAAAAQLIQMARAREPRVGAWWHIDASEAETHAAPQHDCTASDPCPTAAGGRNPRAQRPGTATVRAIRQGIADEPEDTTGAGCTRDGLTTTPVENSVIDHARGVRRFRSGGHWWSTRDLDAGVRAYMRGSNVMRAWLGYLQVEVVDHYTHAPLASVLIPADHQESDAYPDVYARAVQNLGGAAPLLVGGDRGYSVKKVFEFNTNRGVGSVFPYRRANGSAPKCRAATSRSDEHGIPLCRGCGGETRFHRFALDRGKGRLWFRCLLPQTPRCQAIQTTFCREDYRALLPVWRTDGAYAAMRVSHQTYEHKHRDLRIQYGLAPDCLAVRPKRPGRAWQQLRSSAALLVEWLRVLQRGGWNGSASAASTPRVTNGTVMVDRLRLLRAARRSASGVAQGLAPPVPAGP